MDLGLTGRVALVAASSKGLGRAAALALAAEGAHVVICGRDEASLEIARGAVSEAGSGEVLAIAADVTATSAPAELVAAAVGRFERLDIVVANAGGPPPGRALDVDDAALEAAFEANFLTSVRFVREALPHMRAGGWGRICCITSYTVVQPVPTLSLSNAARLGLWGWAKTAAQDLSGSGITLNLACPGTHATDRMLQLYGGGSGAGVDTSGMGDPADFGRVVAFLCSQPAGDMTGTAVVVDGGATQGLLEPGSARLLDCAVPARPVR
ncbi:MAG TPA: SDR family oxidoreductase, partial [Acidimicrobiales bacterium]|nr:SDR family oxidoreductase [Acidimicrobiales bacterium]